MMITKQVSFNDDKWRKTYKPSLERQKKHFGKDGSMAGVIRDAILLQEQWIFGEGEFDGNPHENYGKKDDSIDVMEQWVLGVIRENESLLKKSKNVSWCQKNINNPTNKKMKIFRNVIEEKIKFLKRFIDELKTL